MPPLEAAFYARVSGGQQADAQTIQSQIAALRERIGSDEVLVRPIESLSFRFFGAYGLAAQLGNVEYARPRRFREKLEQWLKRFQSTHPGSQALRRPGPR